MKRHESLLNAIGALLLLLVLALAFRCAEDAEAGTPPPEAYEDPNGVMTHPDVDACGNVIEVRVDAEEMHL